MALRHHSWFDDEKLFPSERISRASRAWMHTAIAPYRWEGELVLTTDRLFFLPEVGTRQIGNAAYWLAEITGIENKGRHRIEIAAGAARTTFQILGEHAAISDLLGNHAAAWCEAIAALKPRARPPEGLEANLPRRAAG